MYLEQFFTDGLACASYLIGCDGAGVAAIVDPDRDVEQYLHVANARGMKITHIIETHLHADHVSGNTDLAERTGAEIYFYQGADVDFPHKTLQDREILQLGNVAIEIHHTPGHTPESISLLVTDTTRGAEPWLILTGDTLFVGDVGRPDLVGADVARQLAADLYQSLHNRLFQLNDSVMVYPGHGAGSLCGRAIGSMRSTTVGYERRFNPAIAVQGQDSFVQYMTHELPEQPANHKRIKAINCRGPRPLGVIEPLQLTIPQTIQHLQSGATLLDTRSRDAFTDLHIPGSIHLPADDQLSNSIGFVLPPETSVVLLVENEAAYRHTVLSLARVGYENVLGYLKEGIYGWVASSLPVIKGDIEDITALQLNEMLNNSDELVILDVREPWEFLQGRVSGSLLIPLGELMSRVGELDPAKPVAIICASGSRSQSAAAFLGRKEFTKVYNVLGGTDSWARFGLPLDRT